MRNYLLGHDTLHHLPQAGAVYAVEVSKLTDFGAFVRMPNGFTALLHISEMAHTRVRTQDMLWLVSQLLVCLAH